MLVSIKLIEQDMRKHEGPWTPMLARADEARAVVEAWGKENVPVEVIDLGDGEFSEFPFDFHTALARYRDMQRKEARAAELEWREKERAQGRNVRGREVTIPPFPLLPAATLHVLYAPDLADNVACLELYEQRRNDGGSMFDSRHLVGNCFIAWKYEHELPSAWRQRIQQERAALMVLAVTNVAPDEIDALPPRRWLNWYLRHWYHIAIDERDVDLLRHWSRFGAQREMARYEEFVRFADMEGDEFVRARQQWLNFCRRVLSALPLPWAFAAAFPRYWFGYPYASELPHWQIEPPLERLPLAAY